MPPGDPSVLARWGELMARRAGTVLTSWLVFIAVGFSVALGAVGTPSLFDRLTTGDIVVPGENQSGREVLARAGGSGLSRYTLLVSGVDLTDERVAEAARYASRGIRTIPGVAEVVNPFLVPGGPTSAAATPFIRDGELSSGGFATVVTFDPSLTAEQEAAATAEVDAAFNWLERQTGATTSERGGLRQLVDRIVDQVQSDAKRGEGIALPVSFLVMIVVFGGVLAAGYPVLGAVASIAGALAIMLGFSYVQDLDANAVNVVTVLGLGLCIDYGLLVVSRFREELRALVGQELDPTPAQVLGATGLTVAHAGRTVVFSAVTVALSLAGLLLLDIDLIRAIALAGISVVVLSLAVALSLIPALCALGAARLLRGRAEVGGDEGTFARLARGVYRAPALVMTLVAGLLVVLALPAFSMTLTSSGAELLPKGTPERTFFEDFRQGYPTVAGAPVVVVARTSPADADRWAATAASRPGVRSVDPVRVLEDGIVTIGLQTGDSGTGTASRTLVDSLRADRPPFPSWVVGQASNIVDFRQAVAERAPYAVAAVVLATFVLLLLMTGSVVIPVKALVMNVLSLGAALGVTVWIFQEGHLEGLLGFTAADGVESIVPLLVVAFGFGLSMDYEVFLLSRIVELHGQGEDTRTAVVLGLQRSGRIITSAALLMVIVFSGFAAGDLLVMKQVGVALVLAIVIDASLVRMLLVPATMAVLGSANWWAPAPLRRLHARFGVTG